MLRNLQPAEDTHILASRSVPTQPCCEDTPKSFRVSAARFLGRGWMMGEVCAPFGRGCGTRAAQIAEVPASDHPQRNISSAGFETRFDLDGPGQLEVKIDAEATGRSARPYCRELAPNPRQGIGNVPRPCPPGSAGSSEQPLLVHWGVALRASLPGRRLKTGQGWFRLGLAVPSCDHKEQRAGSVLPAPAGP